MNRIVLGCIADDYTGASDLANTLNKAGLRTIQTIGVPDIDCVLPDADAVVVALKSRSAPADQAVSMAQAAQGWLNAIGARHILFKICSTFDSTDNGNIGPVMEALVQAAPSGRPVVVTPAFPETGRSVFMGNLFVGETPLNESPLKDHPLNPMTDANLVRVLARQTRRAVGLVHLADVDRGADAVRARLARLGDADMGAAIVDAVFDRDLEAIGAAALDAPLSVGASGLGLGLARALIAAGIVEATRADDLMVAAVGGNAACLAGSCSAATLKQISSARAWSAVYDLDLEAVMTGDSEAGRALSWADEHLKAGPILIASSAPPDAVAAMQARFGRAESGHKVEQTLAAIAEGLTQRGVRRLVVAGGETSGAVIDRLQARVLSVGPEVAPGVPIMRVVAGPAAGMLVSLKSGNFGGPDFFADALRMMT